MSIRGILALCVVLALLGWFGLGYFTYHNPPDPWYRWIALAILWPTLLLTLMPPVYAIHLRLKTTDDIVLRAARQSALAALFFILCAWLRIIRALNWANAILMLFLFVLTDLLLSARESR
jgi:hypothetical protein